MEYVNPFVALGLDLNIPEEGYSKAFLKQERKRILAEFELSGASVIELGGQEVDRSTALKMLDMLQDAHALDHHLFIAQRPSLLHFLEEASLDFFYQGDISLLHATSDEFLSFLGPHFAHSFNRRLNHAYRQKDWEEIKAMCGHPLPIPSGYQASCFKDTYREIHKQVAKVEEMTEGIKAGTPPDGRVQEVCDEMLMNVLNQLPEYFSASRDRYALALENLAIGIHNEHKRVQLALMILRQALKLHINEEARTDIQNVLDQLYKINPEASFFEMFSQEKQDKEGVNPWMVALGVGAGIASLLLYRWLR